MAPSGWYVAMITPVVETVEPTSFRLPGATPSSNRRFPPPSSTGKVHTRNSFTRPCFSSVWSRLELPCTWISTPSCALSLATSVRQRITGYAADDRWLAITGDYTLLDAQPLAERIEEPLGFVAGGSADRPLLFVATPAVYLALAAPLGRTESGYRVFTPRHAAAVRLVP